MTKVRGACVHKKRSAMFFLLKMTQGCIGTSSKFYSLCLFPSFAILNILCRNILHGVYLYTFLYFSNFDGAVQWQVSQPLLSSPCSRNLPKAGHHYPH